METNTIMRSICFLTIKHQFESENNNNNIDLDLFPQKNPTSLDQTVSECWRIQTNKLIQQYRVKLEEEGLSWIGKLDVVRSN